MVFIRYAQSHAVFSFFANVHGYYGIRQGIIYIDVDPIFWIENLPLEFNELIGEKVWTL